MFHWLSFTHLLAFIYFPSIFFRLIHKPNSINHFKTEYATQFSYSIYKGAGAREKWKPFHSHCPSKLWLINLCMLHGLINLVMTGWFRHESDVNTAIPSQIRRWYGGSWLVLSLCCTLVSRTLYLVNTSSHHYNIFMVNS
jgi:hypothetical protein